MKYISWNKITKVSLTGLLICGATLCEKAQAEENNNYSGVTENLINTTVDVTSPEFVSLTSDKTEVRSGERVKYTLKVNDDGKLTTASIVLKNDENGKTKSLYADAPASDGTYSFTLEVDEKLSSGIWRLNEIYLRDDSDNYVDIYGKDALALYSKSLKVGESSLNNVSNNLQPDTEAPKLISIKLNQTNATEHDVVTYTVEASDNRQLDFAFLTIRSVSSPFKYETLTGKLNKEGQLIFRYQVNENTFPGEWQISSLAIYDKAKNISEYNSENIPKESSPILRVVNKREISSIDSINNEKESTLSIHGINNVEKSKNDANILPTDSLSNNQPIDESITAAQSTDKTSNENINTVQSTDKTSNENISTVQSTDKDISKNPGTVHSKDNTGSENSTAAQSTDKTSNENINTVQSTDKNNSESINMELYVQDALQNNGFSPYGEGNLFENANSEMIEKNNELKINQYPKRIERNLPKTGNKLFSVLSILGAINLLLILLRILMKTL